MKKKSPPQKLQRRFSSTSICHRKWCSVISCHCLSSFTLLSGYFVWLYTCTDLWMWSCQMGSADIRLSFVLYNMAVKNTNQRLSLTLIIQPFVFVSIDFVFVLTVFYCINCICISINCISYCTNVQVVREEHKRASLPRTNNSTTIIHLKLGYTLNPRAGCEQFDI